MPSLAIRMVTLAILAAPAVSSAQSVQKPDAPAAVPSAAAKPVPPPRAVVVTARPIDVFNPAEPTTVRFGPLVYRGGIELTSPDSRFGGLSALKMFADGEHFLSLTDRGEWLRGRIVYKDGRPTGVADAQMAPMIGPAGRPIATLGWYDTESLAADGSGVFYVGIERANRILRFDMSSGTGGGRDGDALDLTTPGEPIPAPAEISKLPNNKGLESLALAPRDHRLAGTLVAISERALDKAGDIRGFLLGGKGASDRAAGAFTIKRSDDFDVSDAAFLPGGDLVILERRFDWTRGVAIRMRRIRAETIAPGAVLDGATLMFADMGYQVDNMEGLGVHIGNAGETVLTLISDDNFSIIQRTLLLQFTLTE